MKDFKAKKIADKIYSIAFLEKKERKPPSTRLLPENIRAESLVENADGVEFFHPGLLLRDEKIGAACTLLRVCTKAFYMVFRSY